MLPSTSSSPRRSTTTSSFTFAHFQQVYTSSSTPNQWQSVQCISHPRNTDDNAQSNSVIPTYDAKHQGIDGREFVVGPLLYIGLMPEVRLSCVFALIGSACSLVSHILQTCAVSDMI